MRISIVGAAALCIAGGTATSWASEVLHAVRTHAESLSFRVVRTLPHDPDAFTEGLVYHDGWLFESTGKEGQSTLRRIDARTGKVGRILRLADENFFAEGLALWKNRLFQLTPRGKDHCGDGGNNPGESSQ